MDRWDFNLFDLNLDGGIWGSDASQLRDDVDRLIADNDDYHINLRDVPGFLGLDPDFREKEDTQDSMLDDFLGNAFPTLTETEIQGLGDVTLKLRLLARSVYYKTHPLSFEETICLYTSRELGIIFCDLRGEFFYYNNRVDVLSKLIEAISAYTKTGKRLCDLINEIVEEDLPTMGYRPLLKVCND